MIDRLRLLPLLLLLFLFLEGCYSSSSPWTLTYLKGAEKEFNSTRLSYPIRDTVNGMEVQMVYAQNSLKTYLEVASQLIPSYQDNSSQTVVTLQIGNNSTRAIAHRHQGGQRVSLPEHLQQLLIQALLNHESATIKIPGYETTISPEGFAHFYDKMRTSPPLQNPFQLPFQL